MFPGKKFFVVHGQWMRSSDRLADGVLDGTDYPLHCSDPGVVFWEGYSELNGLKLYERLEITFISVLIKSLPAFTMFNSQSRCQCKCSSETSGDALKAAVVEDF